VLLVTSKASVVRVIDVTSGDVFHSADLSGLLSFCVILYLYLFLMCLLINASDKSMVSLLALYKVRAQRVHNYHNAVATKPIRRFSSF